MSIWSRIANTFQSDRLSREIDEELQSHIEEAIAEHRDPTEARRALGSALLLRPLPVAGADRLYAVSFESPSAVDGTPVQYYSCSYPLFLRMRTDLRDRAEAIAVSYNGETDLTYGTDQDMEWVNLQYVSGWMFDMFRLRPAAGRLLHENDDVASGAHPYAVLSY